MFLIPNLDPSSFFNEQSSGTHSNTGGGAPATGRASIPGLGHTSWSQGWLGDGAATAATGVAGAPALTWRWRARGREGEPGGGVESEGDREGAPRWLSLSPSAQERQSRVATMVKACTGAWRPRMQFVEHVACVGVGKVGGDFGLVLGRN